MARRNSPAPISGQVVLFDSDILIERFRGNEHAELFVRSCPLISRKISAIAYMELLQGAANDRELRTVRQYVQKNFLDIVPVTERVTYQAIRLVERHALTEGLRLADALIAATALVHGCYLATANERHYRFIKGLKLKIYRP